MEELDLVINQEDLKLFNVKLCSCHCTHSGRVFVVVYWQKIGIVVICMRCLSSICLSCWHIRGAERVWHCWKKFISGDRL